MFLFGHNFVASLHFNLIDCFVANFISTIESMTVHGFCETKADENRIFSQIFFCFVFILLLLPRIIYTCTSLRLGTCFNIISCIVASSKKMMTSTIPIIRLQMWERRSNFILSCYWKFEFFVFCFVLIVCRLKEFTS